MGEVPAPFPRGTGLPSQSPLFWVHQKDRYLRQLLITDIEQATQRDLLVYFTNCSTQAQVDDNDDAYLAELLGAVKSGSVDLLLETNGGQTDATEKVISILRDLTTDLRVIVPRRAKSNGTVIALAGRSV
jgi:ClpP class serine protease